MVAAEAGSTGQDVRLRVLHDGRKAPVVRKTFPVLAPYVDNANLLCWDEEDARDSLRALHEELDRRGFLYRNEEVASRQADVLGLRLERAREILS